MVVSDDEASTDDEESDDDTVAEPIKQRRHPDLPDDVFKMMEEEKQYIDIVPDDAPLQFKSANTELLYWHYRLGHPLFERIQNMAKRGDLPSRLANCWVPKCSACLFCEATHRPWRNKAPPNKNMVPPATAPGAVVVIDQLISSTPGLIGQMKGFLTKQRYKVMTVFVDHFSGLSYVHFQRTTSVEQTIEAKRAFERYARAHGVIVKHYHADNGVFTEAGFMKASETSFLPVCADCLTPDLAPLLSS
jgi:GAG-pre-integrase domain